MKRNDPFIVAGIVLGCVLEANAGQWPRSIEQWESIAQRFGATIVFRDPRLVPAPYLRNNVIYIPICSDYFQTLIWIAHECAEAALLWEGEPPYILPGHVKMAHDHDGLERHRISRIVDRSFSFLYSHPQLAHAPVQARRAE